MNTLRHKDVDDSLPAVLNHKEMGGHFGNWLFLKPLVVLMMIILKKFMSGFYCQYYAKGDAWCLPDGAYETIVLLKDAGGHIHKVFSSICYLLVLMKSMVFELFSSFIIPNMMSCDTVKVAVVSNFDTRLRKLLKELNVLDLFDAVIISSEVGYEKPDIKIFKAALDQLNAEACKAVHIGDDQKADKVGANAIGVDCWLWGIDVKTFSDIGNRILISES
ncbi:uncharacterized protein LOC121258081 isoform X3 [Juglans microcarpa x Juglans regia]|uniref:uncharacterized protein LOC121258081 isoform X3 n=1 Tax=Juglans microcarpa x Juglans regia TaxID=2249226 RepID=UPI001B7ECA73|nr:uncharacterized protein LOC121258081 isoform X3 [Juglans microcarpa x Juglans regia]XP_041015366.1 uncharacterized protein LOC121258081 isoform X3 [Juglans microcarpa x Juglans regia]